MTWKKVKLDILCKMNSGGTPSRKNLSFYSGDIPWAKISDIEAAKGGIVLNTEEHITNSGLSAINNRIFESGTLLLAMYGSVGKVAFTGKKMSTNQAILGINIKDVNILDYSYLKYWFQTIKSQLLDRAVGGTLQNISLGIVKELEIPLPPLATQKRIAEILDAADALRHKDQELLKKYDELAQVIFIDMFGDPVKNEKGWDVKKLKDFGIISTGNTPSRADKTNFDSNYIEWIKTDNIGDNNLFVTQSSEYLSEVGSKKGRITPKGSLLVACIAGSVESIGRAALTDRQVSFNQQINSIHPNSNVNARFLYYLFKFSRKHIQNHASNGMKRMLSKGEFEKIKMILPELNVQNDFDKIIQQFELQTDQLKDSNFKSVDLFNTLIQKAFKGELIS
jgi:type I restriction enzyme S subunit